MVAVVVAVVVVFIVAAVVVVAIMLIFCYVVSTLLLLPCFYHCLLLLLMFLRIGSGQRRRCFGRVCVHGGRHQSHHPQGRGRDPAGSTPDRHQPVPSHQHHKGCWSVCLGNGQHGVRKQSIHYYNATSIRVCVN